MTTGTNGNAEETLDLSALQPLEANDRPLIPQGEAGNRFIDGSATQADLDLVMGAGSDTPETQPPAPIPDPAVGVDAVAPPIDPNAFDPTTLTQEQLAALPFVQELQQQQRDLTAQVQQQTQRNEQSQLQDAEARYAQALAQDYVQKDGLSPEVAQRFALREAQRDRQLYETQNQMQGENKLRMDTALLYSKQYGVPAESLLQAGTAKEMELMARLAKIESGSQITGPSGETQVPIQRFENGLGGGSADQNSRFSAIGQGNLVPTAADREAARKAGFLPN